MRPETKQELTMKPFVTESIKYIGVDDERLDLFESQYPVPHGISYNSYLIMDEKTAIMDTADLRKNEDWWKNLRKTLQGRTPDYLVVLHMEPDHTGIIAEVMQAYPEVKIVASERAVRMLPQFFGHIDFGGRTIAVKEGDTLPLGRHILRFLMAPMVHWPEVMVAYEETERIVFSADAFGKFGVLSHKDEWTEEARRYYFNICGKYGVQVQALLRKLSALEISCICPLHGPVLKEDLAHYIGLYDTWSSYRAETEGVLVAYGSIYGGTADAAKKMAELLRAHGEEVLLADLSREDMSKALSDAFRMSRMIVATASYDADVFPPMHDFLHHLKLKNYQHRRVGILENGSWSPCAARIIKGMLEPLKGVEIVHPVVTIRSRMKAEDLPAMEELAKNI